MKFSKLLLAIILIVSIIFISCNSPSLGDTDEQTTDDVNKIGFSITLPGGNNTRAVYTEADASSYKVEIEKNLEIIASKTGIPGEELRFEVTEEGEYTIIVFAYNSDGEEIAKGSQTESLIYGVGVIPVTVTLKPHQKTIEIETIITWESENDNQMMHVSYSSTGNGIDITIKEADPKYDSIRFFIRGGDNEENDFLCYLNDDITYPVSFSYPFVEDGKQYTVEYYCQTNGQLEKREIYTEAHNVIAYGGIGEVIPTFTSDNFKMTATHSNSMVTAKITFIGTGSEPDISSSCSLVKDQIGIIEVAKGTNDWGPLSVYKAGTSYNLATTLSTEKSLSVTGISTGDTYFVQSMTQFTLYDSTMYPYYIRTLGISTDNLTW